MSEMLLECPTQIIDMVALKSRCLGNMNLVGRILNKFTQQLDIDLAALEQAVRDEDRETAALITHRIKGMSANVEAKSLFQSAMLAEQSVHETGTHELASQLARLHGDRSQILASLAQMSAQAL